MTKTFTLSAWLGSEVPTPDAVRQTHDRSDHFGTIASTRIWVTMQIGPCVPYTNLHTVLEIMDMQITALETGRVNMGMFRLDAVLQ